LSGATAAAPTAPAGAATPGGQGTELFRIVQIDKLRVLVSVPRENATGIRTDANATVFVQEFERDFAGKVTRTANALDPASRTMLIEVQIANPELVLMPGMYAQVRFDNVRSNPPMLVPGEALIVHGKGAQVAVLQNLAPEDERKISRTPDRQKAKRIHLQTISIGRDYGTEIEIVGGLKGGEYVVVNPGDSVQEGSIVLPREAPEKDAGEQAGKQGGRNDQVPSGIQSPSMAAPTQNSKPGKGNKKQ
jgi:RND family efflux transporter MFP subunit